MNTKLLYGICNLSVVPVRAYPSDKSEMTTQLLLGETLTIIDQQKQWLHIKIKHDDYTGWIDEKQCYRISQSLFDEFAASPKIYALDPIHYTLSHADYFPIIIGSVLHQFNGMYFRLNGRKYTYQGEIIPANDPIVSVERLEQQARKFINAPYLWGGRTPFGIDCSGFTQVVYRLANIALRRDAWQQATQGKSIDSLTKARPGDLAFFSNEEGRVTHVGILLKNKQIIHAHGRVRVDRIHKSGIFNIETKKYSHKLSSIRRVLESGF